MTGSSTEEIDVGGGRPVATVTDPEGNVLGLLQDR
jgi:predicted enzyme related to lactoylglutathione lyase